MAAKKRAAGKTKRSTGVTKTKKVSLGLKGTKKRTATREIVGASSALTLRPPTTSVRTVSRVVASATAEPGMSRLTGTVGVLVEGEDALVAVVAGVQVDMLTPLAKFAEGTSKFMDNYKGPLNENVAKAAAISGAIEALPSMIEALVRVFMKKLRRIRGRSCRSCRASDRS